MKFHGTCLWMLREEKNGVLPIQIKELLCAEAMGLS
jgi:hypothetical protein